MSRSSKQKPVKGSRHRPDSCFPGNDPTKGPGNLSPRNIKLAPKFGRCDACGKHIIRGKDWIMYWHTYARWIHRDCGHIAHHAWVHKPVVRNRDFLT